MSGTISAGVRKLEDVESLIDAGIPVRVLVEAIPDKLQRSVEYVLCVTATARVTDEVLKRMRDEAVKMNRRDLLHTIRGKLLLQVSAIDRYLEAHDG